MKSLKYLITILIVVFMLTGCDQIKLNTIGRSDNQEEFNNNSKNTDDEDNEKDQSNENNKEVNDTGSNTTGTQENNSTESATTTNSNIEPVDNTQIMVYTIDSENGELEAVTALIPQGKQVTPELIIDTVIDSMADRSLLIGIEKVSTQNDAIIVSFYSNTPPVSNVGSGIETLILDAIAQSLLDNLNDYKKIIYRIEGAAYVTGHIELDLNEVYLEAN